VWGANLGGNFPYIDDFDPETGTATSLKTLDLTADSYQDPAQINGTVDKYIDHLLEFEDTTWHQDGVEQVVLKDDIQNYEMVLGVPAGQGTPEQIEALQQLQESAAERGVTLNIMEVP
jgi:filamentous hemagglutinin